MVDKNIKNGERKKIVYIEPADYFPESLRKKYKLGEFADDVDEEKNTSKNDGEKK